MSKLKLILLISLTALIIFCGNVSAYTVAQGEDAVFTCEAPGSPPHLCYYVFGTNYFSQGTASVDDDVCKIKIPTKNLQTGEYIVIIQHPMNDKLFNVQVVSEGGGYTAKLYATQSDGTLSSNAKETSAIDTRQSANAAKSLCTLIDSEYIDDIYITESFTVGESYININSLGSQIQGSKFSIGGTTNVEAGKTVTVEISSTEFGAVPKTGTSESTYLVKTTKVISGVNGLNGWMVEIDENLAVDKYTVTASIENGPTTSGTFNIVKEVQTFVPTTLPATPVQTPSPEPTKSAGFGLIIALSALGAVFSFRKI